MTTNNRIQATASRVMQRLTNSGDTLIADTLARNAPPAVWDDPALDWWWDMLVTHYPWFIETVERHRATAADYERRLVERRDFPGVLQTLELSIDRVRREAAIGEMLLRLYNAVAVNDLEAVKAAIACWDDIDATLGKGGIAAYRVMPSTIDLNPDWYSRYIEWHQAAKQQVFVSGFSIS